MNFEDTDTDVNTFVVSFCHIYRLNKVYSSSTKIKSVKYSPYLPCDIWSGVVPVYGKCRHGTSKAHC